MEETLRQDRRDLLIGGLAIASAGAAGCKRDPPAKQKAKRRAKPAATGALTEADLQTLAAVAACMIPSDELGPGAREARVDRYLQKSLESERLAHLRPVLRRGARFLSRAARATHGEAHFARLDATAQDAILRRMQGGGMRPRGFRPAQFLRLMLALSLEGFLGHPDHGGNAHGVAWRWLGVQDPDAAPAPAAPKRGR